jgi:hypothetical protein
MMKKITIVLTLIIAAISCKGPGSGPLVKESFNQKGQNKEVPGHSGLVKPEKANISIQQCDGCIKIADLLANKKSYSGKTIKVKGSVTKFNPEIMGKNWVHIQDGTEFNGEFDLTITTDAKASIGETTTFEGTITLDKDFGYGYFYSIIMEGGKPVL